MSVPRLAGTKPAAQATPALEYALHSTRRSDGLGREQVGGENRVSEHTNTGRGEGMSGAFMRSEVGERNESEKRTYCRGNGVPPLEAEGAIFGDAGEVCEARFVEKPSGQCENDQRDDDQIEEVLEVERSDGVRPREPDRTARERVTPGASCKLGPPDAEDGKTKAAQGHRGEQSDDKCTPRALHFCADGESETDRHEREREQQHEREEHLGRRDPTEEERQRTDRREHHDVHRDQRVGGEEFPAGHDLGAHSGEQHGLPGVPFALRRDRVRAERRTNQRDDEIGE